jgi:hypothetical protein
MHLDSSDANTLEDVREKYANTCAQGDTLGG